MERIIITSIAHPMFSSFWSIYETAFPLCERRSLEDQVRIFLLPDYRLEAWVKNNDLLGFIGWWKSSGIRYVEHYAIHPEHRSEGYGSRFLSEWINDDHSPVLLEIEPAVDELSKRREAFYQRLGFIGSDIRHWHPPYHKGMDNVHLWLMSYPASISEKDYEAFVLKQQSEIIPPHTD